MVLHYIQMEVDVKRWMFVDGKNAGRAEIEGTGGRRSVRLSAGPLKVKRPVGIDNP